MQIHFNTRRKRKKGYEIVGTVYLFEYFDGRKAISRIGTDWRCVRVPRAGGADKLPEVYQDNHVVSLIPVFFLTIRSLLLPCSDISI